jgi:uncharacterized protein (DUF1800 family)
MKSLNSRQVAANTLKLGLLLSLLLPGIAQADALADCFDPLAAPVYPTTPNVPAVTTQPAAVRFLNMATFGASPQDVNHLSKMTFQAWVDEQLAMKASCHLATLNETQDNNQRENRIEVWFRHAVTAPDQLRQRVAFALSEVFVVSDVGSGISTNALAVYYDILVRNAFGNFRDILEQVTLSPAMGKYLSTLHNQKADRKLGIRADENYAREVMQLFTIGLVQLDTTGTPVLQNGVTVPTYTQTDVENSAKVLTGWGLADSVSFFDGIEWRQSMVSFEGYHDHSAKTLLTNVAVPAAGKAPADLKILLDTLFNHPNVGPFIGRRLIQRLVTSNPSPAYIQRVAEAFNDNGAGVRGDMKAVISAVLLDPEAVGGAKVNPKFGKLREPLLVLTHLWRVLGGKAHDGRLPYYYPESSIGQAPLSSGSVFNFFRPDYAPSGKINDQGLFAPEFQLVNDANNTRFYNELFSLTHWHYVGYQWADQSSVLININNLAKRAQTPSNLVNYLNLVFTGNKLPATVTTPLIAYLRDLSFKDNAGNGVNRSLEALYLVLSSPNYLIQR